MAQEAILNVSLKDYKKNIDELRASLLGLEKDSDDYKKIAEELKDKQDKLNEVMSVGKESVNALDGSYNQLSATLSQLKKEWKNMEIGTPEWEAMAVRINDINNQLKDADSQVGVFTRNVGDYANAFEEAFKKATDGLATMPGVIGNIAGTAKQLIPLIQKTTATATKGLAGIKKALVSTGIGALIVAVGLLLANFDKIRDLFKGKDNPAETAAKSFDTLKKSIDAQNDSLELETQLMEAAGASTEEVRLKKIELIKVQQAETLAQLENVRATIKQIEAHSKFRQWITGEKKDLESLRETEQELFNLEASQSKEITKLLNSNTADRIKEKKKAADEEKKLLDSILKRLEENSKSEIQILKEKYKEEYALLKKSGKDTSELTKQTQEKIEKIREQNLDNLYSKLAQYSEYDAFNEMNRSAKKAEETLKKFAQVVNGEYPPKGIMLAEKATDKMLKKAKELGIEGAEDAESFALAYKLAYKEYQSVLKNADEMRIKQGEGYIKAKKEFEMAEKGTLQSLTAEYNMLAYYADEVEMKMDHLQTNIDNKYDWEDLSTGTAEAEQRLFVYNERLKGYKQLWLEISPALAEAKRNLDNYNISEENLSRETDILEKEFGKDNWMQWFLNTDLFYETYRKRLDAAIWYRDNLEEIEGETNEERRAREEAAEEEILKIRREYSRKHIEISQEVTNSLVAGWSSMLDRKEALLKQEKVIDAQGNESRKYTDKEIFERTKSSRIAVATIETIQGALAAFMGYQSYPQPYGAILGAAQAAAVTAAGMAQIAQIRATEFSEAGQNISNPQAVINATPRMVDYSPDLVSNLTGASEVDSLKNALQETPIYVSVTDINNAQAKVTDRDKESSF